jgi:hypothetical protein
LYGHRHPCLYRHAKINIQFLLSTSTRVVNKRRAFNAISIYFGGHFEKTGLTLPTKITSLPALLKRIRTRTKQLAAVQATGAYSPGAWIEKRSGITSNKSYWCVRSRSPNLPNGSTFLYVAEADLKEWRKAIARGRKIVELQRDIRDTQRRIEALTRRAEQRGIVVRNVLGDPDASPEHYTPLPYIELVREVLGEIDLDPASNALAQTWIRARTFYTKEDDGLVQPWCGSVYLNPPYGSPEVRLLGRTFSEKAIAEYQAGTITAAIILLNRTGAQWYKHLQEQVTAVCEVYKRIAFLSERGEVQQSPRYYNDFLYLGPKPATFRDVFGKIGKVQMLQKT